MPIVEFTRHLYRFFPQLESGPIEVAGTTVAEVVEALEAIAPGVGFYLLDESGRLRKHVNIFVDHERIRDRTGLSDPVGGDARIHILQALSGG
jgi:sulfur-carrier protein